MKAYFKKNKKFVIFLIVLLVFPSTLTLIKTDYYFMSPGPPYQWDIEIESQNVFPFTGNLYQLTVRRDEANYLVYLWSFIDNRIDLYPREVILPNGVTPDELTQISLQNMKTSENVAIAVALNELGYDISTTGDGVLVVGLLDDSPVKDKLIRGDLITSINDLKIESTTEFIATLRTYKIGDEIKIGITRSINGVEDDIFVTTNLIEHVEYEGEPMVGFLASTVNESFEFPFNVDIKTGNVGGPSAGLMMALNVYNLLTEEDITNSKVFAGTGTIEIDGSVGPVGGVKQKVIAAKKAGAEVILVPVANYDDAKSYQDDKTKIIPVESFEEALEVILNHSSS